MNSSISSSNYINHSAINSTTLNEDEDNSNNNAVFVGNLINILTTIIVPLVFGIIVFVGKFQHLKLQYVSF